MFKHTYKVSAPLFLRCSFYALSWYIVVKLNNFIFIGCMWHIPMQVGLEIFPWNSAAKAMYLGLSKVCIYILSRFVICTHLLVALTYVCIRCCAVCVQHPIYRTVSHSVNTEPDRFCAEKKTWIVHRAIGGRGPWVEQHKHSETGCSLWHLCYIR